MVNPRDGVYAKVNVTFVMLHGEPKGNDFLLNSQVSSCCKMVNPGKNHAAVEVLHYVLCLKLLT